MCSQQHVWPGLCYVLVQVLIVTSLSLNTCFCWLVIHIHNKQIKLEGPIFHLKVCKVLLLVLLLVLLILTNYSCYT